MNILGIKVVMFEGLEGRGDLGRGLAHLTPQAFSDSDSAALYTIMAAA